MESLIQLLIGFMSFLNTLTPLAVIALLGTVIFLLVYKKPFTEAVKPIQSSLEEVKSNHLHELPAIAANMERVVEILQRIEVKMSEDFAYLKARMNGGR